MKRPKRRLHLERNTVRRLTPSELRAPIGGGGVLPSVCCTQNPNLPTSTGRLGLKLDKE